MDFVHSLLADGYIYNINFLFGSLWRKPIIWDASGADSMTKETP